MAIKQTKTNVQRILEKEKIPFCAHSYSTDDGRIDGVSVAEKLGMAPDSVLKTLVTRGSSGTFYVFVIPVALALDLKAAALSVGEKSVSMLAVRDLLPVTGYVRGGCSPIGMKKKFATVVDRAALSMPQVVLSAGKIGEQVEMSPADLQRVTGCLFAEIASRD